MTKYYIILFLSYVVIARAETPPSVKSVPKFSHVVHAQLPYYKKIIQASAAKTAGHSDADRLPCDSCHALATKLLMPLVPGADGHKPCSDSGCHGPRLTQNTAGPFCVECHAEAQPWGASPSRLVHREDSARELGWRINHRRHLAVPGLSTCDTCHQLSKLVEGEQVTVSVHRPGHADCAPCHGKQGSFPSLTQCSSCHLIGDVPKPKVHGGELTAWRVYEKFSHEHHRLDIRTARPKPGGVGRGWIRFDAKSAATLGCGACHETASRSESVEDMDLLGPCAMGKTCMGQCHNGRFAFQGSGTNMRDCLLCHTGVDEKTPAPASHCGS
jgi:hypothetical protein